MGTDPLAAGELRVRRSPCAESGTRPQPRTCSPARATVARPAPAPILLTDPPAYAIAKRGLDIVVSALMLLVTCPILLVIALLIKLDSPGPTIFVQERLGRGLRPFRFYKFRTMRLDAQRTHPGLYAFEFDPDRLDRAFLVVRDDPRVTRVGRPLRRFSLDELPNLVNVLRGEISLVGPRPEIPQMLPYYETTLKFSVPPGVTGLAQVGGRGKLSFLETVRLDEQYVFHRSFGYDLRILCATLLRISTGTNY